MQKDSAVMGTAEIPARQGCVAVSAMMTRRTAVLLHAVALLILGWTCAATAQEDYPTTAVRLLVGFPPGGPADSIARLVAQKLSTQMNANVIVETRSGANGNIAAESVARAKPDGYTLLFNSAGAIFSRALGEKVGYDVLADLAPVAIVNKLNAGVVQAIRSADFLARLTKESAEPRGSTPAQYGGFLKSKLERWTKAVKQAYIKMQ